MTVLLTLTTTHRPATDLGLLLEKQTDETHTFLLPWGAAHVFFPEATEERCTAALLLDVDPLRLAKQAKRRRRTSQTLHHLHDRPFAATSLLGATIAQVFPGAPGGESEEHRELAERAIPLRAHLPVVACEGGERFIRDTFALLECDITVERLPADPRFGARGRSELFAITLEIEVCLAELLAHLSVLLPVLDEHDEDRADRDEARLEGSSSLGDARRQAVIGELLHAKASRVLDLGCGGGRLVDALLNDNSFERVIACDVSPRALERAARALCVDRMPDAKRERLELIQGSALYRDPRFGAADAICLVEVIEHIHQSRLPQLAQVVFGSARPRTVIVTTPNREHNVRLEGLAEGTLRHADHRFEWTRAQLTEWCEAVASEHGYDVEVRGIGEDDEEVGPPTQMATFRREESAP